MPLPLFLLPLLSKAKSVALNPKVLIVAGIAIAGIFLIWRFENNIKKAAFNTFYAQEVAQAAEEQNKKYKDLEELRQKDQTRIKDLMKKDKENNVKYHKLLDKLKNFQDGPVAPVLKEGLREIENELKGNK